MLNEKSLSFTIKLLQMNQIYKAIKAVLVATLLCVAPSVILAQSRISGTVTDQDKQPLVNVSVLIKGTNDGTVTDANGHYTINAAPGKVLVFRFLGFLTQEITVGNQTTINVFLSSDNKLLKEVVISALGVTKATRTLGYATQTVKGDELITARDPNPINGLIGKVSGLQIGATSEVLGVPNITIRGSAVSLFVVDGLPFNSDTFDLSPDDIESYTVLKGPAAAALYGSRAQSGAIIITTKKGDKNKKGISVDLNSSTVINTGFVAFPRVQNQFGPGENEFYEYVNGMGGAPGGVDADYDIWGPYFAGQPIPQFDSPVVNGVRQATPWLARGKNNLQNFLRTGFQTNNNVAISDVGDNYNVRFSASQEHQNSYIPSQYLDIGNANVYASFNANSRLKFEASIDFNRQSTDDFPDVQYGPNSIIYELAIWTGADWSVKQPLIKNIWAPGQTNIQQEFEENFRYENPYLLTQIWTRGHYKNDVYGYITGNYKIDNHLNVSLKSQIDTYNLLRTEDMPWSAHPYGRQGAMGDYREDRRDSYENNTLLTLNYNYTIDKFFNLSGLAGTNLRTFKYNSNWTSTDYLNVPAIYSFSNSENPIQSDSFNAAELQLSEFVSMDASFGKYATLSGTIRHEYSSAFQQPTSYWYPSVSAATVISDYVQLPEAISFLKARVSYANIRGDATSSTIGPAPYNTITAYSGQTVTNSPTVNPLFLNPLDYGSVYQTPYNGPTYGLNSFYATGKPYNSQIAGYGPSNLYQNGITTSSRVNYEEGFDIKFLRNRLGLSATAFQYVDGPQILQNPISTATGYQYEYVNALKLKTTGYELSLEGTPVKQTDGGFGWDVLLNWSTFKQIYDQLPQGQSTYNTFFHQGDRTDILYGTAFVRTPQGQIINGSDGEPLVNPVEQNLGHINPDFNWSLDNTLHYRSVSLGFQFDGEVGGSQLDYVHKKMSQGGSDLLTDQGALGAARYQDWLNFGKPGYNGTYVGQGVIISNGVAPNFNSTTGQVLNYGALQYAPNTQTAFVQEYASQYYGVDEANRMSKTYFKLRELTIGYELPKKWLESSFIRKASFSIYGRNLLYFYKDAEFRDVDLDQYSNASPAAGGYTGLQSPSVRSYGVNIKLSF